MAKSKILLIEDKKYELETIKTDLMSVQAFNEKFEFIDSDAFIQKDLSRTNTVETSREKQKQRIMETINKKINGFDLLLLDYILFDNEEIPRISVEIAKEFSKNKKVMIITGWGIRIKNDEMLKELSEDKNYNLQYCARYDFLSKDNPVLRCKGVFDDCKRHEKSNPPTCKNLECFVQRIIDFYEKRRDE